MGFFKLKVSKSNTKLAKNSDKINLDGLGEE